MQSLNLLRCTVDDANRIYWIMTGEKMKSKYCEKYSTYVSEDFQDCETCKRCADGRG